MKYLKIALTSAIAVASLQSLAEITAVKSIAWNGDPKCWQMMRHGEKMQEVASGGAPVVFIGDSITHFWERNPQWKKYFGDGKRKALNLGTSGDRTEHVIWRLQNGELDGYEAKCIVLMIGTNNTGHRKIEDEPPAATIHGIRKILDIIAEKQPGARTILLPVFPRSEHPGDELRARNDAVNKEICKFADGRKVIWCDFNDKFLAPDGRLGRDVFPDLLHPNSLGYEIWAGEIIPMIDKVLDAEPGDVIPSRWPSLPAGYVHSTPAAATAAGRSEKADLLARNLEKLNTISDARGTSYDIVMVGDSITHNWETRPEGAETWGALNSRFKILNLGYSGDRTENVIWRLENGELDGYSAKAFQIMIGTNNNDRDSRDVAKGVARIVELVRAKHPESKVLLMPIFPRGENSKDKRRAANEKANAEIRKLADGKNVILCDINDRFLLKDGKIDKSKMTADLLHLSKDGYAEWSKAMTPAFELFSGRQSAR